MALRYWPPVLQLFDKGFAMNATTRFVVLALTALLALSLGGCAPEVGSEKWCANLKEKPKGEWSLNETTDYAKHCLIK
jgi:hypothetical protein